MFSATKIILIVDREDEVLELLKSELQSIDYVVLQAKTGEEALGVLSRLNSHIDLTLIDFDLALDDGVFVKLLAIFASRTPRTRLIVKTSRHDKLFLEQVNYLGVDAFVFRPISEKVLIERIRATLRVSGTLQPEHYVELRPSLLKRPTSARSKAMTPVQAILIVDRQEDVFRILEEQLAPTNYALLHATDGEEAIALVERLKSQIELAIVDVEFPDLGGWDLIGRLAHHDNRPAKIIATISSIYANEVLLDQMKGLGVDVVLRKPIPQEEWRTILASVIYGM